MERPERRRAGFAGALLILPFLSCFLWAQEASELSLQIPPRVQVTIVVERSTYQVDEQISYHLRIRWQEEKADIKYAAPTLPLENLAVVDVSQSAETRLVGSERVYERFLSYRLKPIRPGPAAVGRFVFEYGLADSDQAERVPMGPTSFVIKPLPLWRDRLVLVGGSTTLAVAAVFFGLVVLWRKKRKLSSHVEKELSLEEDSLERLGMIQPLIEDLRVKDYMSKSGEIFQHYLSRRYDLGTSNLGGLELVEWIQRRRDIDGEEKRKITAILEFWNETQFAGVAPGVEEARAMHRQIAAFIGGKKVV